MLHESGPGRLGLFLEFAAAFLGVAEFVLLCPEALGQFWQLLWLDPVLARDGLDGIEALLDPVAARGIHVDGFTIAAQHIGRFADLDAGAAEHLADRRKRSVELRELFHRAQRVSDQAIRIAVVLVVEPGERRADALGQSAAVLQPGSFAREFLDLAILQRKRVEFIELKSQQVEARSAIRLSGQQRLDALCQRPPLDVVRRHDGAVVQQSAEMIEQIALHVPAAQRLVEVLAMNVEQQLAERLELGHGHRVAVDEGPRPAIGINNAPEQAVAFEIEGLFLQPTADGGQGRDVELRCELGTHGAIADELGAAALAKHESKGVDENGLARAGLAGQHGHALGEFEVDAIDDREITNLQVHQHGQVSSVVPRLRLSRPQNSLERRML